MPRVADDERIIRVFRLAHRDMVGSPFRTHYCEVPVNVTGRGWEVEAARRQVRLPCAAGVVMAKGKEIDGVVYVPVQRSASGTALAALSKLIRTFLAFSKNSLNIRRTKSYRVVESQRVVGSVGIEICGRLESQRIF